MTGHSHFQTSSTSFAKVGKMTKGRLVASVASQELVKELVLPHCESVNELEYLATCFGHVCGCIKGENSLSYQGKF